MRLSIFCFTIFVLLFSACDHQGSSQDASLNFSEHIAPIIHKKCAVCHQAEGPAPFSLIDYSDIIERKDLFKYAVKSGFMPPWPADKSYAHYVGEKSLSKEEKETIATWIKQGMLAGDTATVAFDQKTEAKSILGEPDLVLRFPKPLFLKGDNSERFFLIKLPYELERDTFVRAIEFVPGNTKVVHHVNGFIIQYDEEKKKNHVSGEWMLNAEVEYEREKVFEKMNIPNDDGTYPMLTPSAFNYLPGMEPIIYPQGLGGFKLKRKGHILLRDIHYGPSREDQMDSSYVNIYFDSIPPKRRTLELQMGTLGSSEIKPPLIIQPNIVSTFTTQSTVPIDISVLSVNPHMHLLGKSYLAFAVTPRGDTIPIVKIPKWDFRWQYTYTFSKVLVIPAGSTIYAIGTYDNTSSNPYNPYSPPQVVAERDGSMRSTDEMFQLMISYLPYQQGDEDISLEP